MSRIAKYSIPVPASVSVDITHQSLHVKGSLGSLQLSLPNCLSVMHENNQLWVKPSVDSLTKSVRSLWGTFYRLVLNMVHGVHKGFSIRLELEGVGYRAFLQGQELKFQLGYSHDVFYVLPEPVKAQVEKQTVITLSSYDRQVLGQAAATICSFRPVEPYKGKGIKKAGAFVFRKEGKKK